MAKNKTNTRRIATRGLAEEFRDMEVGEVVQFPLKEYKYSSIRSTPASCLMNERVEEGRQWKVCINHKDKCADVTRIA